MQHGLSCDMAPAAVCFLSAHDHLLCVAPQVSVKLHLDDPLDAIAVHAWNGTWGVIAVGLFASQRLIQVCPAFLAAPCSMGCIAAAASRQQVACPCVPQPQHDSATMHTCASCAPVSLDAAQVF